MGLRKHIDGLEIVDLMCEAWGENLEQLNLSEKLWMIRNAIAPWCDFDLANQEGLDPAVAEASDALLQFDDDFYVSVVFAFSQYLGDDYKPLGYYLSDTDGWTDAAVETWGDFLDDIPENDGLIFLFNTATHPIDFDNLPNRDDMKSWLDDLETYDDDTVSSLVIAIATIMHESH